MIRSGMLRRKIAARGRYGVFSDCNKPMGKILGAELSGHR
jgi:hypothetical protein